MNAQEFSSEFDIYYNNVSSNQAPGLTEYEKSVLLTNAQYEILKNYFTPVQGGNKYQEGFEDSKKRNMDFSVLITVNTSSYIQSGAQTLIDLRGKPFERPSDIFLPISETFYTSNTAETLPEMDMYQVIPLKYDEYIRLMSRPSTDPVKKQVWRLSGNSSGLSSRVEIIPHWKDAHNTYNKLSVKYIRKPYPIILEDLQSQGLSIEGKTVSYGSATSGIDESEVCELAPALHKEILMRAVELAKVMYLGDATGVLTAGQRSE